MAAAVSGGGSIEVSPWLKSMPVAPEYHPTLAEFQDPIAYIFKIEKEASKYGICKIVPPVPAASKKTIIDNLNKSLLARSNDLNSNPTFTTRQQQIGFCPRKHRPVQKSVWQSGERYTLVEFETKAKNFEKSYLKKYAKKTLSALDLETLYWNATADKPFSIEYANDMPGSAFPMKNCSGKKKQSVVTVGETEWNMRNVSRSNSSLLKFMMEEIPGVTSPMVYLAMLFSWFAWHVEDHDLHSLNYLHMGAPKTWYGVPRDAAVAFEEVIREQGYRGEINPLITFATLGEKTTVMSPEVLLSAGVPCCRLVQNAGEFVVTFPRAYHSGFSHGFNCGEASNVATPEWLRFANEAAIRRASINCPPMVSHYQLLYDLALWLCSRVPKSIAAEPRSSRLKDKKKGEGEMQIKELFLEDMMQNNNMLHILCKGAPVVLLPKNSPSSNFYAKSQGGFQSASKSRLFPSLCSSDLELRTKNYSTRDDFIIERKQGMKQAVGNTANESVSVSNVDVPSLACHAGSGEKKASQCDQGLFSCVTCGILCFACAAIVQPTKKAACWLISADCDTLKDLVSANDSNNISCSHPDTNTSPELMLKETRSGLLNTPICSAPPVADLDERSLEVASNCGAHNSSLGLLALTYGNSSDSEEDEVEDSIPIEGCGTNESIHPEDVHACSNVNSKNNTHSDDGNPPSLCTDEFRTNNCAVIESNSLAHVFSPRHQIKPGHDNVKNTSMSFSTRYDEDSSRLHVFCLQHAVQVEKQLRLIGGAHVVLVCHPDYLKLESEARKVAEELEGNCLWSDISFREANVEDEEMIRSALDSENAIHGNGDWAVKLGINLFYSASLSRSPLYCKQMPYNYVIYSAFGCSLSTDIPAANGEFEGRASGRVKKIVVAGKWCGKVWMSSQAHPLLVNVSTGGHMLELETNRTVKPSLRHDRPLELKQADETTAPIWRTTNTAENRSHMKAKSPETEETAGFTFSAFRKRKRGGARLKKEIPVDENLDESSEELQLVNNRRKNTVENSSYVNETEETDDSALTVPRKRKHGWMQSKKETPAAESLDESSEELQVINSCKLIKSKREAKQIRKQSPEAEILEESSEEFSLSKSWKQRKRKPGKKPVKTKTADPPKSQQKSKKQLDSLIEGDVVEGGPSTRLRRRTTPHKNVGPKLAKTKPVLKKQQQDALSKKGPGVKVSVSHKTKARVEEPEYLCDMEGCAMSFGSKQELALHKRNICPVKGCGKKFFSHKYLVQHRRVHMDDRPLKCPWKGCKMTFKWAWARTEHIRVHTGARPYVCTVAGCGQTFRFVSDFSRHKRKTGHAPRKARGQH